MIQERFTHVPFSLDYQIGDNGTVLTNKRSNRNKTGTLRPANTRPAGKVEYGYLQVILNRKNEQGYTEVKANKVHRMVATAYVPNPHNYPEVNHIDGNKLNNHYTNLEWCTHKQNMHHAHSVLGFKPKGRDKGFKHKASTLMKLSRAKIGERHPKFKGWYQHNHRSYVSLQEAADNNDISTMTVLRRVRAGKDGWAFIPKES